MRLQSRPFVVLNTPTAENNPNSHNGVTHIPSYGIRPREALESFSHPPPLLGLATPPALLYVPYSPTNTNLPATAYSSNHPVGLPQHKRPLYSCVPLPGEPIELHPMLQYGPQSEWNVPSTSSGSCCHCWSPPATTSRPEALTVVLPWLNIKLNIKPSRLPTPVSPCDGIVTVRDVLVAIGEVMDMVDTGSLMGSLRQPEMLDNWGWDTRRRCACMEEVVSLEYLRHRYGRAGLTNLNGESNTWVLRVG